MSKVKTRTPTKKLANLFRILGQVARLRILLAIGEGEACVCHLEAVLGYRQAYISQQLMELRRAGLLDARREGRFVFYQLHDPGILELVQEAATLSGIPPGGLKIPSQGKLVAQCSCPHCAMEPTSSLINIDEIV